MEIKNSCMNKTPRLKPNPLDIIIITKLNNDIKMTNNVFDVDFFKGGNVYHKYFK
jgi:hypothetical protein